MTRMWRVVSVVFAVGIAVEVGAQTVPDKKLPKTGSLSSSYTTGQAANFAEQPFGFDELNREQESPITGSVSRLDKNGLHLKVFNNSQEDTYSVDVEVLQRDDNRTVLKRDYFSYTLPPQGSKTQSVFAAPNVKGADLNLLKWKNLTAKKRAAKASTPEASTK